MNRCPRPCNKRPDDFTVAACVSVGECGCGEDRKTAAILHMQAAAKRMRQAKDLRRLSITADEAQEIVADYFEAREVYRNTKPLTRRQRKAERRAQRMLTYPPREAAEYRDTAFKYLTAAADWRRAGLFVYAESMLDMAAGEQIAANNNGFYLP